MLPVGSCKGKKKKRNQKQSYKLSSIAVKSRNAFDCTQLFEVLSACLSEKFISCFRDWYWFRWNTFLSVLFANNNKKIILIYHFLKNKQLCILDCHNLFSLIFSSSFINVILPLLLRILLIIAVDVQLVPLIINAGCTGKDVTDTD